MRKITVFRQQIIVNCMVISLVGLIVFLIGICYILMVSLFSPNLICVCLTSLILSVPFLHPNACFLQGTFCMKSMKHRRMIEIIQRGGHISRHPAHGDDGSHA